MRDFSALAGGKPNGPSAVQLSVALSMASRPPVVNRHPALRSPDFPLRGFPRSDCLASFINIIALNIVDYLDNMMNSTNLKIRVTQNF